MMNDNWRPIEEEAEEAAGWDAPSVGHYRHGHLLGHPEAHATTNKTEPDGEVVLSSAFKARHGVSQQTGMKEEKWDSGNGMMLSPCRQLGCPTPCDPE